MGSPKALLRYRDETFLDRLIGLFASRLDPVIVVLGANAEEIRSQTIRSATFVVNGDYTQGQTSSLQCGLRALPPAVRGVLFTLVDHPAVEPATLDALLQSPAAAAGLLRVPRYQGRRGHPIWFSRDLAAEFLALPATAAARDVVRAHAAETTILDLDDPGIAADIDHPAAYRTLLETGR